MAKTLPQPSHITRKAGVYYCRRRLPGLAGGEVALTLRTKRYREAEHRAALLDDAFGDALRRAGENMSDPTNLNAICGAF